MSLIDYASETGPFLKYRTSRGSINASNLIYRSEDQPSPFVFVVLENTIDEALIVIRQKNQTKYLQALQLRQLHAKSDLGALRSSIEPSRSDNPRIRKVRTYKLRSSWYGPTGPVSLFKIRESPIGCVATLRVSSEAQLPSFIPSSCVMQLSYSS